MRLKAFLLLGFLFCGLHSKAQFLDWKRAFSVDRGVAVSTDVQGNIYLSTKSGEIQKYSAEGLILNTYSPSSAGYFSILDATSSLQIKAFNESTQTLVYLDRFLNPSTTFELPAEQFNFISALGWSAGHTIWIAEAGSLELKKWRIETKELLFTLNLNKYVTDRRLEIILLKEYQHKLYLFGINQLLIFDQLGNYEQQLLLPDWKSVAFSDNEMILLGNSSLHLIHLYSSKVREIPLPTKAQYELLGFSKGEVYLFTPAMAEVYKIRP